MPETDILNPTAGWDPTLGDSMNPSFGFTRKRASTILRKKAVGGTPWTRETQNTGHEFSFSWLGRTWACVQRLKRYYEQYEDGFFTIIDHDGGGRHYVGRFTGEVTPIITANNKWDVQNAIFEEVPGAPMVEYPSDWTNDAVMCYPHNDFGDQKMATSGTWTTPAATTAFENAGNAGEWAAYEYRGYGFQLYMQQGPDCGKADVYLDDVLQSTVDLYAAAATGSVVALTAQSVPLDIHRVKVVCDGTKNGSSSGTRVRWYSLQVMR